MGEPVGVAIQGWPEVVALAGAGVRVYRTAWASYVLGADGFVVVVEAGDRPDGTAVQDRGLLLLVAPFPEEVNDYLYRDLTGARPGPSHERTGAFHGFVRVPEGYLPLGPLRYCGGGYDPDGERLVEFRLRFEPELPFAVLDRVRSVPPAPPPVGTAWLDGARQRPVDATREFLTDWYADVPPVDPPPPPAPIPLPAPLAAFYAVVAGRDDLLGRQDRLFRPHELRLGADGWLEFGAENQGGFTLAVDPALTDPPVLYRYWTDEPIADPYPLSTFLLLFALYEASFTGPYLAFANLTAAEARRLTAGLRRVPLSGRWFPSTGTEFHVGNGLVVQLTPRDAGGDDWYTFTSARHRAHLEPLRHLGITWGTFGG